MGKIEVISYDEIVEENKKRRAHFGLENVKKTRIQSIVQNKDEFAIKIYNVGLKQESTYPVATFIKAYLTYKDIYFTNITTPDFREIFEYKSKSARLNAQQGMSVKAKEKKTTLLPVMAKMLADSERLLKEMAVKQQSDRSEGITVVALAAMCLEEIRKGNGDKHILLSDDDELNGMHTCFEGLEELDCTVFSSDDCHDNNDISKCMIIL